MRLLSPPAPPLPQQLFGRLRRRLDPEELAGSPEPRGRIGAAALVLEHQHLLARVDLVEARDLLAVEAAPGRVGDDRQRDPLVRLLLLCQARLPSNRRAVTVERI